MGDIREAEIDAGARYLRETQQGGKKLTPWSDLPNSTKRKWRALAEGALRAAAALRPSADDAAIERVALSDVIETGDYLVDRYKVLWRGGIVRDLAEAIGAWEHAKRKAQAAIKAYQETARDPA